MSGAFVLLFLVIFGMIILLSWFVVSNDCTFDNNVKLLPGKTYQVAGRTYPVPALPHKILGTTQTASLTRPIPKLPDDYLLRLKALGVQAFQLLRDAQVPFWVTGGTLFSAHVWQHFMPFDDDIDISVQWEDRAYLWSPEFAKLALLAGLETIALRGSSLALATREGGGIRLRPKGEYTPMLDIFFTQKLDEGHYGKIDAWVGDKVSVNQKEVWDRDWLFPLHETNVDGMVWPVPNQPEMMLKKQYGPKCLDSIQSPDTLVKTHKWVTYFTNIVGAWRRQTTSTENDRTKLVNPRGYVVPIPTVPLTTNA